jgi:hypothetical protein
MTQPADSPREVVELRVHGVHGTPPAEMLGIDGPEVRQVAGDNLTGFYRSKSGELPYRKLAGRSISVEAYSWGTLTSGVRGLLGWVQRALWLLLLPFALANLAYWARIDLAGKTPASRSGARYTRLGALLLTMFMVLIPSMIGVDLIAWQCYRGDSPGCDPLPGLLDFMADVSASQRLAIGSLLPLLFVGVLWFLSRQSLLRYEVVEYDGTEPHDQDLVLRHRTLWSGKDRTQQLQRVHLSFALAVVVGFSGFHVVNHQVGGSGLMRVSLWPALVVATLGVLWVLILHPDDVEYAGAETSRLGRYAVADGYRGVHERLPRILIWAACATTLLHLVLLWNLPGDVDQAADYVGDNTWFITVFVSLTAVHLALFTGERMSRLWSRLTVLAVVALGVFAVVVHLKELKIEPLAGRLAIVALVAAVFGALGVWQLKTTRRHHDKAWNGAGSSVMLATAAWIALLFTTGAVTATANYLNGGEHGVDDLVSRLDTEDSIATEVVSDASKGAVLSVSGDVVIRDAVITLDGPGPVLRSGTIESERLFDVTETAVDELKVVALQKGRTRLDRGTVELEANRVRIQDSCVRLTIRSRCSPESSRFLVGGMLTLPPPASDDGSPSLTILSPGDGVELAPSSRPSVPLVVPQVLIWAPLAQTLWLVASLVWLLVAVALFRRSHPAIATLAQTEIAARDQAECTKARQRAAFAHRAERLLDGIGVITSVLAVALIGFSATGKAPWDIWESLRPFATAGMFVALAMGLALVLLSSRFRASEGTRKAVGVVWDLTTFWPRAVHPLAPPCYAERVVPELRTRVDWALHHQKEGVDLRAGNRIVLSGHSQGSVIVCAVLSRMTETDLARTRVITYGSQIRALYGRIFPAVFGPAQIGYEPTPGITTLAVAVPDAPDAVPSNTSEVLMWRRWPDSLVARVLGAGGAWVNLFRRSDPLGFRVFSDYDLAPDHYVPEVPDVTVGDAGPKVNTHSGYQHTRTYRTAIAEWTGEEVQLDPVGTTEIPALPT